jgi:hypothetical protein
MGFMDKAKKFAQDAQQQAKDGTLKDKAKGLAQQAQQKLDEVQGQFNESQKGGASTPEGPVVEYDKHGRPVTSEEPAADAPAETPPPAPASASPEAEAVAEAAATVPPRVGGADSEPAAPADVPPVAPPPAAGDVDRSSDAPPEMTSGDPLAG